MFLNPACQDREKKKVFIWSFLIHIHSWAEWSVALTTLIPIFIWTIDHITTCNVKGVARGDELTEN